MIDYLKLLIGKTYSIRHGWKACPPSADGQEVTLFDASQMIKCMKEWILDKKS